MADTPVKTVRTVHLVERDGRFIWLTEDGLPLTMPIDFGSAAEAQSWLFTPVVVESEPNPEEPK